MLKIIIEGLLFLAFAASFAFAIGYGKGKLDGEQEQIRKTAFRESVYAQNREYLCDNPKLRRLIERSSSPTPGAFDTAAYPLMPD